MADFFIIDYLYRDADNYKTYLRVAIPGDMDDDKIVFMKELLTRGNGFIPGQVGLPDLQMNFNAGVTFWDDERDHPFHELQGIKRSDHAPPDVMLLNSLTSEDFLDQVASVIEWDEEYRPDFHSAMAELKKKWDRDPDEFMRKAKKALEEQQRADRASIAF